MLEDEKPSIYLNEIYNCDLFQQYPFDMLYKMKTTEQSPIHHPEGNVWIHDLLVVDEAAKIKEKSKDKKAFMWAALLHDIGKPVTTKNKKGKITAYDHDKIGETLSAQFLSFFIDDKEFIHKVSKLIRYHMQILFVVKKLPFAQINTMLSESDYKEVALLGYCDRLGRININKNKEKENINIFLNECKKNLKNNNATHK